MRRAIFHQQTFHTYLDGGEDPGTRSRGFPHFPRIYKIELPLASHRPVWQLHKKNEIKKKSNVHVCVWGRRVGGLGQKEKVKWKFNDAINWPKFSLML